MTIPEKKKIRSKRTLHCLVDARAYNYLQNYALERGRSVASYINDYLLGLYETQRRPKNVHKNINLE